MSAPVSLLLDVDTVRVVRAGDSTTPSKAIAWSPDDPDAMVDAVRAQVGSPSAVVIVVGLGLLEIAQPDLPPMRADARRAVLWRDADRYFPLEEPVAVVCADAFAFALPVRLLERWVRAIRSLGPVKAIVTAPQLCARLADTGAWSLPVGVDEQGVIRVRNGLLVDVRRELAPTVNGNGASSNGTSTNATSANGTSANGTSANGAPPHAKVPAVLPFADPDAMGRYALRWIDAPLDAQLLDVPHADGIRRARQRRWMASVVLATAAVIMLAWSANRWRAAQLVALESRAQQLEEQAAPAMRANARGARAHQEMIFIATASTAATGPDAPLVVLAQLSRLLPRDVIVQRLEWNGEQWRVEGTADNAPRLVPLLDADTHFRDVRIAAPSQRFLDAGRQRESFAISFRTRAVAGGARGTP